MISKRTRLIVVAVAALVLIIALVADVLWLTLTPPSRKAAAPTVTATGQLGNPPGVAYANHFQTGHPGAEWSAGTVHDTPNHKLKYLGPFREEPVTFSLDHLPPHAMVRLRFDLVTFDRWNGDGVNFGRDLWDLRVVGGQPLIHTTFNNCGFFINNDQQSFPDQYPWYPTYKAWTGAAAKQSLGHVTRQYADSWGDDSTYTFDLTFPHAADTLQLVFKTQIKHHDGKPYGFLNFQVDTVAQPATATDAQLAGWWADLAGVDPVAAYRAVWSLVATADAATAYIAGHLPDPKTTGPAPINVDMNARWTPGCFQYETPQSRQVARATHVLEVIGTSAAKKVLDRIGYRGTPQGGPPDAWSKRK